jgi:hypothetical protein
MPENLPQVILVDVLGQALNDNLQDPLAGNLPATCVWCWVGLPW